MMGSQTKNLFLFLVLVSELWNTAMYNNIIIIIYIWPSLNSVNHPQWAQLQLLFCPLLQWSMQSTLSVGETSTLYISMCIDWLCTSAPTTFDSPPNKNVVRVILLFITWAKRAMVSIARTVACTCVYVWCVCVICVVCCVLCVWFVCTCIWVFCASVHVCRFKRVHFC